MSRRRPSARVCVLTPAARGAVAVVRVWGPQALAVADSVFRPARGGPLSASPPGAIRFGRAGAGHGDEVVAVVVADDGGPPEVELHGHGGPAPVALVVDALVANGARRSRPEAWLRRDSGATVAAQALADLAHAPTLRTAEILLEQAQGMLGREVARVARRVDTDPAAAADGLDALIARAGVGRRLVRGWTVVLAGRPNVGKSRLLNALAGYDRVIVDPTPGTTRDVVEIRTACDGWPVVVADTAGLRAATDALETAGVGLARARQAAADLTVLVLDRSEPLTGDDLALLASLSAPLVVANKSDLPPAWDEPLPTDAAVVAVSALSGDGLDRLVARIADRLVPVPPIPGQGVPFRSSHVARLHAARAALDRGDARRVVEVLQWFTRTSRAESDPTPQRS